MTAPVALPIFDPAGIKGAKKVNSAQVMMTEGMHDTAIITLRNEPMDVPELQPGTPVRMQYGWLPVDVDIFYGYVDHIQTHYDRSTPSAGNLEDVVCLGVSYSMKDPFVGAWQNVPASSVVELIAKKYFLSSLIEKGDYTWPNLGSPGDSAWSYLNQLANKLGYSVAVNQSLLRFISVDTSMKQHWVNMPVFRSRNVTVSYSDQSIVRFNALQGEALPVKTKAIRTVNGMDLRSGQIVGAVDDGSSVNTLGANVTYPFFGQQISDQVVTSQGQGQALLAGMTQKNRFTYQATASLAGLTAVKQGMPIVLSGIDGNNDGMWWVQEVTHKITANNYSMDVSIGRDALGDNGVRPVQTTGTVYTPSNPFTYSFTNAPPTVMYANRWRASTNLVTYVAG